jgi:hypothetical protein
MYKYFSVALLKVTDENSRSRIRMSRIRSTVCYGEILKDVWCVLVKSSGTNLRTQIAPHLTY